MVRLLKMSWLVRWGRQRAQRPSGPDLANMGTCVGLDAAFEAERAPAPSGAARSHAPEITEAGAARTLGSRWAEDRLNGRSVI